jgi:HPt (histidine-containing phosphotransfer) domain-containing protein
MRDSVQVLDPCIALARVGGDADLLKEIGALFVKEYPALLTRLAAAVSNRDDYTVERTAHSLKGSASNFGARAVCDAALALELAGRRGDLTGALEHLRALEAALTLLHSELESL